MKKRLFALTLAVFVSVALSGCGAKIESEVASSSESTASNTTAVTEKIDETEQEVLLDETDAEESDTNNTASVASETIESSAPSNSDEKQTDKPITESSHNAQPPTTEEIVTTEPVKTPEPTKEPETAKESEVTQETNPSYQPTSESTPISEILPKSIYDAPFDTEAIKQELIAIGESQGLTYVDDKTPTNSGWASPVIASESFQGVSLERGLKDYVRSMPEMIVAYGGQPIQYFTIYVEPLDGGRYQFYYLY